MQKKPFARGVWPFSRTAHRSVMDASMQREETIPGQFAKLANNTGALHVFYLRASKCRPQ